MIGSRHMAAHALLMASFLLFSLAAPCDTVNAMEKAVSSGDLINRAKEYDGKVVLYRGEAITAVMRRGPYAWINVNDGANAIGIWCRAEMLSGLRFTGNYKNRGDILEVEGVFNRACDSHGGDPDLHASRVEIMNPGFQVTEKVSRKKLAASFVIFFAVLLIVALFRKRLAR